MYVIFGVTMISIGNDIVITRGMPGGKQVAGGSPAKMPCARCARYCSRIAWYSGVSGGGPALS